MQILIGLFQHYRDGWNMYWTLDRVGATLQIEHDTWPRWREDDYCGEQPVALGVVTLQAPDGGVGMWRAECQHPDGQACRGVGPGREEALEALKADVRTSWKGRVLEP